jgi:hypothetical protein
MKYIDELNKVIIFSLFKLNDIIIEKKFFDKELKKYKNKKWQKRLI